MSVAWERQRSVISCYTLQVELLKLSVSLPINCSSVVGAWVREAWHSVRGQVGTAQEGPVCCSVVGAWVGQTWPSVRGQVGTVQYGLVVSVPTIILKWVPDSRGTLAQAQNTECPDLPATCHWAPRGNSQEGHRRAQSTDSALPRLASSHFYDKPIIPERRW